MSKILVTGGTGYIGSHTVVELQSAGYEVIIIDNLENSTIQICEQIEKISGVRPMFFHLDLSIEADVLDFAIQHKDIVGVIHFAAYKAVGESVSNPHKYYRNNLFGLINLLTAFQHGIRLVFSSSCTVYGQPDSLPVTEDSPIKNAESPYGNTKQVAEEILQDLAIVNPKFEIVCLRYFNPVGAHPTALIGELPIGQPANLVPYITQSVIGKRGPLVVHGADYKTPDGSAIRDYIHVVDVAKAHVAALKFLEQPRGEHKNINIFNISTGKGSSVLEVINAFERTTGVKVEYSVGPRRDGDVEQVFGDTKKSSQILKWNAELDLDEMLRSAWAWEQFIANNGMI